MKSYKDVKKKLDTKLISIIAYIILVIAILSLLFNMLSGNNKDNFFGYTLRLVVSGSMEPEINVNSINIIKTCDIEDIDIEDIICFRYNQDIVHRVTDKKVNSDGITVVNTKGDSNETPDNIEITNEMIVGKVVFTWNSIAPIIEKYSIEPGKIDSMTLARNIMIYTMAIGIVIILLFNLIKDFVNFIKFFIKSKNFDTAIETYIADIDELILYRELLIDLNNKDLENKSDSRFEYIGNRLAKANMLSKCRELHLDINKFKHSTKNNIFWARLFKTFDVENSSDRQLQITSLLLGDTTKVKDSESYTKNEETNTNNRKNMGVDNNER